MKYFSTSIVEMLLNTNGLVRGYNIYSRDEYGYCGGRGLGLFQLSLTCFTGKILMIVYNLDGSVS
ncbi:hypothetical protein MNBD_GAMMA12-2056 [hydrothermal vent metagenome]|uniref:Uncharacterized protein n=1 Tax=hydrothermal vent metagenome TaxID=652676 RepID=A0A3B0Y9F0_9ZZZZ